MNIQLMTLGLLQIGFFIVTIYYLIKIDSNLKAMKFRSETREVYRTESSEKEEDEETN